MGAPNKTHTTTTRRIRSRVRRHLEGLSTREAQLFRMRHGVAEDPDSLVGEPPEGCSAEVRRRVRAIEADVLARARGRRLHRGAGAVKRKIVRALRHKH